jgi:uncharacterized protein YjbJ (UPF0337 family)
LSGRARRVDVAHASSRTRRKKVPARRARSNAQLVAAKNLRAALERRAIPDKPGRRTTYTVPTAHSGARSTGTGAAHTDEIESSGVRTLLERTTTAVWPLVDNSKEQDMSNMSKRVEGKTEQLGGKIKGTVGSLIGNKQMEAEGKAKELKGKAKQEAAKAGERIKGKVEELKGNARQASNR